MTGTGTPGLWSNPNGAAVFNSINGLAIVNALNLANDMGTQADFGSHSEFAAWLLAGNAVNMAYMLSVQAAAMALNVAAGFVPGSALVSAGTAPAGCAVPGLGGNGMITVQNLLNAANAAVGSDPYTPAGDPNRACQEFLKNALDAANNNTGTTIVLGTTPVTSVPTGDLPALSDITYGDLI